MRRFSAGSLPQRQQAGRTPNVKAVRAILSILVSVGLVLTSSCSTSRPDAEPVSDAGLPSEVSINSGAGRGDALFVTLRLESGEELPFFVDTGSTCTCLDRSLEPKLGKCLGTTLMLGYGGTVPMRSWWAPRLFLGHTPIKTGRHVYTLDCPQNASQAGIRTMGILGMDCLRHYCIQLDFAARKMRFLDPEHPGTDLGRSFPLTSSVWSGGASFVRHGSLVVESGSKTLVDTGCNIDGLLVPQLFEGEARQRGAVPVLRVEGGVVKGPEPGLLSCRESVWAGETYTDLVIGECGGSWMHRKLMGGNAIGLRFLARHQVTFNFPKGVMYLKRISAGPL